MRTRMREIALSLSVESRRGEEFKTNPKEDTKQGVCSGFEETEERIRGCHGGTGPQLHERKRRIEQENRALGDTE